MPFRCTAPTLQWSVPDSCVAGPSVREFRGHFRKLLHDACSAGVVSRSVVERIGPIDEALRAASKKRYGPRAFVKEFIDPVFPATVRKAGAAWARAHRARLRGVTASFIVGDRSNQQLHGKSIAQPAISKPCAKADPECSTVFSGINNSADDPVALELLVMPTKMLKWPAANYWQRAKSRAPLEGRGKQQNLADNPAERARWLRTLEVGSAIDVCYRAAAYAHAHWHEGIVTDIQFLEGDVIDGAPGATKVAVGGSESGGNDPQPVPNLAMDAPSTCRRLTVHCLAFPHSRLQVVVSFRPGQKSVSKAMAGEGVLAPAYTQVRNWRQQLRQGTKIEVHRSLAASGEYMMFPRTYWRANGPGALRRGTQRPCVWELRLPLGFSSFHRRYELDEKRASGYSLPLGQPLAAFTRCVIRSSFERLPPALLLVALMCTCLLPVFCTRTAVTPSPLNPKGVFQ